MAGTFSGHLINSFQQTNQSHAPFGEGADTSNISIHGAMSFDPSMHGSATSHPSFSLPSTDNSSYMDLSDNTALKIAQLQAKLDMKLGPEYISQRPGPSGGPKLTYAEGWKIINLANEVFGFNGWSSRVVSLTTDFIDFSEESRRYTVGVTAIVRVSLRDGVFHEDIGYGMIENSKSKGGALDKCKKEAVTDAIKRTLRNFGNLLGNCLYDKSYTQEIVKIKVPPAKFDKSNLYRRPEFADSGSTNSNGPATASTSTSMSIQSNQASSSKPTHSIINSNPLIKSETPTTSMAPPQRPNSTLPPHMRPQVPVTGIKPSATSTPVGKGKAPAQSVNPPPYRGNNVITAKTPVQKPAPQQHPGNVQPSNQHQPQQQLQRDRRISLAPLVAESPTTTGLPPPENPDRADESFSFSSDDDAFLAAVDLGQLEEGLGGHTNFEEGCGVSGSEGSTLGSTDAPVHGYDPPELRHMVPCDPASPDNLKGEAHNRIQEQVQISSGANAPSTSRQQQPQLASDPRSRASLSNTGSNVVGQQSSLCKSTHVPPLQTKNHNHNDMQNRNESRVPGGASSGSSRPVVPSMGGFHFPPGVKLPDTRSGLLQQSRPPGQGSGIGSKRPAEAMGSSNSGRRPVQGPGMGLAQQTSAPPFRREPLGNLEIGDGGDVKRIRR